MNKQLVLESKLSFRDYYERNIGAKTHVYVPIYLFDLEIANPDSFTVEFEAPHNNMQLKRTLILAPNGRVIASRNGKLKCNFMAKEPGRYTIKYWIDSWCVFKQSECYDDLYYNIRVYADEKDSLVADKSKIRVYSMLGVGREGTLFKGDKLKEKCMDQYKQVH